MNQTKVHVSEEKKKLVERLRELMKKRTLLVASIKSLPGPQFQQIKKKLRTHAVIMVAKKSLIEHALENADEEMKKILDYITSDYVLIFSDEDAFELAKILADNTSPAKAKIGQEAPEDIKVEAGPTNLVPGPDISALSAVGLKPKVEDGKISIEEAKVIVKKGEVINEKVASILGKLDITPFKIGIEPLAAFCGGKIYTNIKIDVESVIKDLEEKYSRSLAFAVSLNYLNKETIGFILGKAGVHEKIIDSLIKENVKSPEFEKKESEAGEKVEEKLEEKNEDNQTKSEEEE